MWECGATMDVGSLGKSSIDSGHREMASIIFHHNDPGLHGTILKIVNLMEAVNSSPSYSSDLMVQPGMLQSLFFER
jgi:hypothetical protein